MTPWEPWKMSPPGDILGTCSVKAIAGQCPPLAWFCGAPSAQEQGTGAVGDGEIWAESGWSRTATSEGINVCFNARNSCLTNLSSVQVGTRMMGWLWRFLGSSWIQAALPGYVCESSGKRFNRLE